MNTTRIATNRRRATQVAGALGCLVLLGAGCSKTEPTTTAATTTTVGGASTTASTTASSTTSTAAPNGSVTTAGGATASDPATTVTVKLFSFKPSPLTVKVGTTVTWTNGDDAMHEPTSGTEANPTGVFDVTLDGKGSSGTFTFDRAGTYAYFCQIHTSMTGEIVVS